jgi:hypothetical protein
MVDLYLFGISSALWRDHFCFVPVRKHDSTACAGREVFWSAPGAIADSVLSDDGLHGFESFLLAGPHQVFATSQHGSGFSSPQRSGEEAREKARANCRQEAQNNESCKVVSVDTTSVSP